MNKINSIAFVALRDNLGATGGPGGVLFIQRQLLGSSICGKQASYRFNFIKTSNRKFSIFRRMLNLFLFFFYFLFKKRTYFVTHDVETGRLLAHLHKRYSLVYHHQGSIVKERSDMAGHELTGFKRKYYEYTERKALTGAETLHFPSNGAAEMYFKSDYSTCKKEDVRLGQPLYNVILPVEVTKPIGFDVDADPSCLTFFSLGTLTAAKGQDQTVHFLSEFVKNYKKPMRYILLGAGPLREMLINKLDEIQRDYVNFSYRYFDKLPHEAVMYLHKISDVYIMLHRISIFDFATLEAMTQNSAIVLSKVGGNPEFNRDDNIVFAEDVESDMSSFALFDFEVLKRKNKQVYDQYFSPDAFREQYIKLFESIE